MKKFIALITTFYLSVLGIIFAEDVRVLVEKYPGRSIETHSDYYRDEIKRVTISDSSNGISNMLRMAESAAGQTFTDPVDSATLVAHISGLAIASTSNVMAALDELAPLTFSNQTASVTLMGAAAVIPTIVSTSDTIAVMESAAALTFSNSTDIIYLMELSPAYEYGNITNVGSILTSCNGRSITNLANILTSITNNSDSL